MSRRRGSAAAVMVVVLMAILAAHRSQRHRRNEELTREKEQQLVSTLATLRGALTRYEKKHHRGPHTLAELVSDGTLASIPADPVTGSHGTWRVTTETRVRNDDFKPGAPPEQPVIIAVHSGATGADSRGKPFAQY